MPERDIKFAPRWSIRFLPFFFVDHGSHELHKLLGRVRTENDVDDVTVEVGETKPGTNPALAKVVIPTFDRVREHGGFIGHWRFSLSVSERGELAP